MFFKNVSEFQCGVRTKKEVLTVYPGTCIRILEGDFINISDSFEEISYEEYVKYEKSTGKENVEKQEQIIESTKNKIETPETIVEKQPETIVEKELTEQAKLEKQLEDLKKAWQEASRPKRKETIQNQIKEVQEKLNKLKG